MYRRLLGHRNIFIFFISYNIIKKLPKSIGNLKSLQVFHATKNQLKSIPESFGNLEFLGTVNLSDIKLDKIT